MKLRLLAPIALFLLTSVADARNDNILLSTVKTLTLRNDQTTAGRRLKPISQLKCVGGDARGLYEVDVMRCINIGSDYGGEDVAWSCSAELPRFFKLGATDVLCEGYSSPEDRYVLKGLESMGWVWDRADGWLHRVKAPVVLNTG